MEPMSATSFLTFESSLGVLPAVVQANFPMWATFAIITLTIIAYAMDQLPIEAVSLASIGAFLLLFALADTDQALTPAALMAGFANPALVTVLALLVVGQALFNTDALDQPSRWLAAACGSSTTLSLAIILSSAAIFSALINNTPVVIMLIPILTTIARQKNFEPSKGLLPLSYAAILGGMTTLIGSSTNLLVAGIAFGAGIEIGFFDFTVPGLFLAATGCLYVFFILPAFLHRRAGMTEELKSASGKQFITQIDILPGHPLEGMESRAGMFVGLTDMTVRVVLRRNVPILPPFEDVKLSTGDSVIVAATRQALTRALSKGEAGVPRAADCKPADDNNNRLERNFTVAEAVIPPGTRYVTRTISGSGIASNEGVVVLGVQRKSHMQRTKLSEIRLEPGDTILVGGTPEDVGKLRASRDLLLLEWSAAIVPMRRYAPRAMFIFVTAVLLAATETLPIMVAAMLGAMAMIATGCITVLQAKRAFDSRIFMMVGASLAAATALEHTGGAMFLAHSAVQMMAGQPPGFVLSIFFIVIAVLTNIMSNNATAVLFTPIAIEIAREMGVDPMAFVVAVIFAANCSFATPVGYQTNLLVMAPGNYRFNDFVIAGTPLVILIWLTYSFIGPWYYGL
jgi:di/tricarboxylate transporter